MDWVTPGFANHEKPTVKADWAWESGVVHGTAKSSSIMIGSFKFEVAFEREKLALKGEEG